MKAFLLAAGLGTRLRPLTDSTPKCLVPLGGRPLLSYWLELLAHHGFEDVLINLHHLPDQVRGFLRGHHTSLTIRAVEEPALLGSAGTVAANGAWIADDTPFLVAYADNLTDVDLGAFWADHLRHRPVLSMGLYRAPEPSRCGIAELRDGWITAFEEKPSRPRSDLANAGLYITDRRILDRIPRRTPVDFGFDVLPALVGQMRGYLLDGQVIDVGTPESYARAQEAVGSMGTRDVSRGGRS